jgi:serine/threonine-protein kinase
VSGTERRRGFGLTLKVFAATALVVVAVLGISIVTTATVAGSAAERALDEGLKYTGEVARQNIDAENAKLAAGAAAAAQNTNIMAAVVTGDPGTVLDQANVYREILDASYTLVTDNHGVLTARTDRPGAVGDSLGGSPLVGGALEGNQIAGYVNKADQKLFLAVATPLKDFTTNVVQAVLLSADEVTDSLADEVKMATGSEIVFYVLDADQHPVIVASSMARSPALDSAVRGAVTSEMVAGGRNRARTEATIGGTALVGLNVPLVNPGVDRPMGGYLALRSRAEALAGFKALQRTLIIVALLGLVLALLASYFVARQITKPVRALVAATERVAEGDYAAEVPAGGRDEIGQLAASFKHMVGELKAKQQLVEYLSGSAGGAATQPLYTAGGDVASPTMVRSIAGGTGMLAVGQTFAGRYDVKSVLGMGGMGVVYRALDRELGEPVAIKTLKNDAVASDPAMLARFKDEIRLARKITHRNVVRTHDLGEVEGMYYITMEFIEGQSLKHLIQSRGQLPVNVALTLGKQLCRALEVAHEQGVIHRDIKPQNLIVDPGGTLKVMDFGIARLAVRSEGVTQAGMAIGTPEYMAPEQLLGDNVDFRADIYATGCVLFECLTGRTPFIADSPISLVAKQLEETPASPASLNAEVPEALAQLILRTLSKRADDRPQSAAALHDELDAIVVPQAVTVT